MSAALCGQVEHGWSCFAKGKFCNVAGQPVNKGLGMLQMSVAEWTALNTVTPVSRPTTAIWAKSPAQALLRQPVPPTRAGSPWAAVCVGDLPITVRTLKASERHKEGSDLLRRSEERRVGKECRSRWPP